MMTTMARTMVTDVDGDDNKGNDANSRTRDEGDNHNQDNDEGACASTATTPAHR